SLKDVLGCTPSLSETAAINPPAWLTIQKKIALSAWDNGKPLTKECTGIMLEHGEVCYWEEPAELLEYKTKRHYEGGTAGFSFRLMRGVRAHVGGFKGYPIDTTSLKETDSGKLHITTNGLCYAG